LRHRSHSRERILRFPVRLGQLDSRAKAYFSIHVTDIISERRVNNQQGVVGGLVADQKLDRVDNVIRRVAIDCDVLEVTMVAQVSCSQSQVDTIDRLSVIRFRSITSGPRPMGPINLRGGTLLVKLVHKASQSIPRLIIREQGCHKWRY